VPLFVRTWDEIWASAVPQPRDATLTYEPHFTTMSRREADRHAGRREISRGEETEYSVPVKF
jgi:hypothetical protein